MRIVILFFAVLISVSVSGCVGMTAGLDPRTHHAVVGAITSQYDANKAYWRAQGESYEAGGGGQVIRTGPPLRAPAEYQFGVLINLTDQDVTFLISPLPPGTVGLIKHVSRRLSVEAELPPGHYEVTVTDDHGSSWDFPQRVDGARNSTIFNDTSYDFSIVAKRRRSY